MKNLLNIAWAAGLFEGEGSIMIITRNNNRKYVRLRIASTDFDVIDKFVKIVKHGGTSICTTQSQRKIKHWECAKRNETREILNLFIPFLGRRRKEKAIIALETISKMEKK